MLVALQMYDLPELKWATDALGAQLLINLRRAGFPDVPYGLDREGEYKAQWTHPELLLAQTCGYPLVTLLQGKVRYLATPCYTAAYCSGPRYCSLIVVRADDPAEHLPDLRGRRAAYNRSYSQSGYNAFRHAVAPLSRDGRFFGETLETGGHGASLLAVTEGRADVATIDAVTMALLARHRPAVLQPLKVIGRTASAPNLPFITRGAASDQEVERLRQALTETFAEPTLSEARQALLIAGLEVLDERAYAVLNAMEREAAAAGYVAVA
jgi:ABC-type phosphate/phosphonate transport system substrate-binding protein